MNDDEFEMRLMDLKAKFIETQKAEMAFKQAVGQYDEAINRFLKDTGVNPLKGGGFNIVDLIDKVRRPKTGLILPS